MLTTQTKLFPASTTEFEDRSKASQWKP